ncbi:methyl-accepting chemotaxis protein [Desulfurispira natronophila]|uniref:Methyl-accepting chemotaxis protein n=1 Tax=Desulfurispira natronophila TaxID=682562 RepID=A0A7W8DGS2_9BACT|nr:methyl-accepting chemotaxis protein [Desulfurispira natronophila]MBB5021796.1 methyl-accepting chemotaxis protein [Desulfurispira natronophila]
MKRSGSGMQLRTRITLLTSILVVGIIIVGMSGYYGIEQLSNRTSNIGEVRIPTLVALATVNGERMSIRAQTLDVLQYEEDYQAQREFQNIAQQRQRSWELIDENWKVLEATPRQSEAGRQAWRELQGYYNDWRAVYRELDQIIEQLSNQRNAATQRELFANYREAVERMIPISNDMGDTMQDMVDNNIIVTNQMANEAIDQGTTLERIILAASIGIVVFSIAVAIFIIQTSNRIIVSAVRAISDGNSQVVSASDQIASASSSLAEGASEQANSVEEVTATIEEAASINNQNADNIREADQLANQATGAANQGYDKVQQLMSTMEEVSASSERISHIIKTIDEIAFQTNLLALNAAVEAARAGEHGMGFAVVAEEVKSLAQRSANAARETADIIKSTISQIQEGNQVATETNLAFDEIRTQIKKTSDLIGEITVSVKEQTEGMNQVSSAMSQIDKVTQQNAANSEEAAAAAEQLNAQAVNMLQSVASVASFVGFRVEDQSMSAPTKKRPSPVRQLAPADNRENRHQATKTASRSRKDNHEDDIFPMDEDDMREF